MFYGTKCWAIKKHVYKMSVDKMKTLKYTSETTRKDGIWNEDSLKEKTGPLLRESSLKLFGHVQRRAINEPVRKSELTQVDQLKKRKRRPKITLVEAAKKGNVNWGGDREYDFGYDRMVKKNTCCQPWLVY